MRDFPFSTENDFQLVQSHKSDEFILALSLIDGKTIIVGGNGIDTSREFDSEYSSLIKSYPDSDYYVLATVDRGSLMFRNVRVVSSKTI